MNHSTSLMTKAFTLVEIVMSVGLMAVLAVGVNTYFISSLRSARKAATVSIVKSEGEQIQTNIVQMVKFAKRIGGCPSYTSLILTASDGSEVTYTINSDRILQTINYPSPTPDVSIYLNSTKTLFAGCGNTFACIAGGSTVDMCFLLSSAGAGDVTEATSMTFRNYIYNSN